MDIICIRYNFFIKNELKINNDELLEYCKNNPILIL